MVLSWNDIEHLAQDFSYNMSNTSRRKSHTSGATENSPITEPTVMTNWKKVKFPPFPNQVDENFQAILLFKGSSILRIVVSGSKIPPYTTPGFPVIHSNELVLWFAVLCRPPEIKVTFP
jgi:hypothetical protein